MASRRKLSLLAYEPLANSCCFLNFSVVLFALYHYCFLLYSLFQKSEMLFGCVFTAESLPKQPNSTFTTGDQ
jgi:hypothetical protein